MNIMRDYFIEQAAYQRWANSELFKSLDTLTDAQRHKDLGLFFGTIHKTLDHTLVVTRNWRARLAGEFDKVTGYDTLLYSNWDELKASLDGEFRRLGEWLSTRKPEWFADTIEYPSGGKTKSIAVRDALIHIMIHAVHHRGQVSAACTELGAPSPEMDFVFYRWRANIKQ